MRSLTNPEYKEQGMNEFEDLENFIGSEIAEIEADERYHYASASVFINAPLALIQTEMRAKMNAYKSILEKIKELKGAKDE